MKVRIDKESGFVFVTCLGVLAVLFIIVFGVASVAQMSYQQTGRLEKDLALELLVDEALLRYKDQAVSGETSSNRQNFTRGDKSVFVTSRALPKGSKILKSLNLEQRDGDVRMSVKISEGSEQEESLIVSMAYIVNMKDKRLRPIRCE